MNNLASSKMTTELHHFIDKAIAEKDFKKLIHDRLAKVSVCVSTHLNNPKNDQLWKLRLIFSIFPKLERFMETPLWREYLSKVGNELNFCIICRDIIHCANLFPAQLEQAIYAAALLEFPSSGFPLLLADLPLFLELNLLVKIETLKNEASKAAAGAKHPFVFEKYIPVFKKKWDEVPAEDLPDLKEGMCLRNEILHGSASITTLTKDQQNLVKSYVEFTKSCEFEAYGK
jgi:hypothetical protein